ncbi:MAG: S41 family peptidase [Armatimonadetes bacterium]|nr:S41 family peptidase [Armatimonadota bacterium]
MITREERIFSLVTVYSTAKQHFAYFDQVPDLDWDKAFKEYLPLVEKDQTLGDYYRVLDRFVALLRDGHTDISPPPELFAATDRLPLRLDLIEEEWVVTERYPVKEILADDVPPGSVLLSIEGMPPADYYQEHFLPYISAGSDRARRNALNYRAWYPTGDEVEMKLRYPDGSVRIRKLRANQREVEWTDQLAERYLLPWHRGPMFRTEILPEGILHVRYGECSEECLEQFCSLIDSIGQDRPTAMILDLRGNGGGLTPVRAIQRVIAAPIPWDMCRTRWSISYLDARFRQQRVSDQEFEETCASGYGLKGFTFDWFNVLTDDQRIEPAEIRYDGPLYILTDGQTTSAAEDFVVLLHGTERATVCGEPTCGETGQPIIVWLPGGGYLRVCTVQVRCADGTEFMHKGYQPHVPLSRTIKGIAECRDEVLEAVLERVRAENRG